MATTTAAIEKKLAGISEDKYLRERLEPRPGDPLYLHLSDLLIALKANVPQGQVDLLDFGCGGSPYRSLFPETNYDRADIAGVANIDYEIKSTPQSACHIDADSNRYDFVLSSQVLEHVPDPQAYLVEAYRVLKPGGQMLLTTHGIFEDHGCPYDFRRWTSYGLTAELESAGFDIQQMSKMTTGPRAAMFLLKQHRRKCPKFSMMGAWVWATRIMLRHCRRKVDQQCDQYYSDCRVVTEDLGQHKIYVALMAMVQKKSSAVPPPVSTPAISQQPSNV